MKTLKQAVKAKQQVRKIIRRACPLCGEKYRFIIYSRQTLTQADGVTLPQDENYCLRIECSCKSWELYGGEG